MCISESNPLPYISQFKDTIGFINKEKWYKLSVSIGYAPYHHKYSTTIGDILRRANELMQRNKQKK